MIEDIDSMIENDLNRESASFLLVLLVFLVFLILSFLLLFLLLCLLGLHLILQLHQPVHSHFSGGGHAGGELEGSSCEGDLAGSAFPDSTWDSLHTGLTLWMMYLATWRALIFRVLLQFEFLNDFSDGSTVSGSILSCHTHLLSSLGHYWL